MSYLIASGKSIETNLGEFPKLAIELQELLLKPATDEALTRFEELFTTFNGALLLIAFTRHATQKGAIVFDLTRWPKCKLRPIFWDLHTLHKLNLTASQAELLQNYDPNRVGLVCFLRPGKVQKIYEVGIEVSYGKRREFSS